MSLGVVFRNYWILWATGGLLIAAAIVLVVIPALWFDPGNVGQPL